MILTGVVVLYGVTGRPGTEAQAGRGGEKEEKRGQSRELTVFFHLNVLNPMLVHTLQDEQKRLDALKGGLAEVDVSADAQVR